MALICGAQRRNDRKVNRHNLLYHLSDIAKQTLMSLKQNRQTTMFTK